jgi:hypothetical protein
LHRSRTSSASPLHGRTGRLLIGLVVVLTSVVSLDFAAVASPRTDAPTQARAGKATASSLLPAKRRIVLRRTKPVASNTGVGVIAARPTRRATSADGKWKNGVLTIKKNLKNRIVNGTVKVARNGLTIQNCLIRGDARHKPRHNMMLVNTDSAHGTVVRYNDIRSSFKSRFMNGIGHRNVVAEFNDISHITDGFIPAPSSGPSNVHMVIRGNYVHAFQFFGGDSTHGPTPLRTAGGIRIRGRWAGRPWNHADGVQVEKDRTTGINIYGNNFVAKWAKDSISTLPLPNAVKELSVFMLNGGRHLVVADNWLDGGEYTVNNGDRHVTGRFARNRFGRGMAHRGRGDRAYFALVIRSSHLLTYDGSRNRNVWADSHKVVRRRNG